MNESGQVLLLLSLIAIGREIGREVQVRGGCASGHLNERVTCQMLRLRYLASLDRIAHVWHRLWSPSTPSSANTHLRATLLFVQAADDFSSFLEKENELEAGGGFDGLSSIASDREQHVPQRFTVLEAATAPTTNATAERLDATPEGGVAAAFPSNEMEAEKEEKEEESGEYSTGAGPIGGEAAIRPESEDNGDTDSALEDVTRPMGRHPGRSGQGGGGGAALSVIFAKKRVALLGDGEGASVELSGGEDGRDARRDRERTEVADARSPALGDGNESVGNGDGQFALSSSSSSLAAASAIAGETSAGSVRLAFRRKGADVV